MSRRIRRIVWAWCAVGTLGCEGCREQREHADTFGESLRATDCPPDVAVCVGGEAFQSVGHLAPPGEPCRQNTLGACERACLAEGVAVAYPAGVDAREQLCAPAANVRIAEPLAPGAPAAGEVSASCRDGQVVVRPFHEAAGGAAERRWRCAHGCATDDSLTGELLDDASLIALLCRRPAR